MEDYGVYKLFYKIFLSTDLTNWPLVFKICVFWQIWHGKDKFPFPRTRLQCI